MLRFLTVPIFIWVFIDIGVGIDEIGATVCIIDKKNVAWDAIAIVVFWLGSNDESVQSPSLSYPVLTVEASE